MLSVMGTTPLQVVMAGRARFIGAVVTDRAGNLDTETPLSATTNRQDAVQVTFQRGPQGQRLVILAGGPVAQEVGWSVTVSCASTGATLTIPGRTMPAVADDRGSIEWDSTQGDIDPASENISKRAPGCRCHWEEGDSTCPVHGEEEG